MLPSSDRLNPAEVCHLLRITPNLLQRLITAGWLETAGLEKLRSGEMRLFHRSQVEMLVTQMALIRRSFATEDNHRLGGQRAARLRERERKRALELKQRKEEFLLQVGQYPEPYSSLLRAGFFLYHLNHYAKLGETYLYDLKEQVLSYWVKRAEDFGSAFSQYFLAGTERTWLCPECRAKALKLGKSYPEYVRLFGGCSQCIRREDYYSLYEFIITYDSYRFSFHIPEAIARGWSQEVPARKDGSAEREGFTCFGRPIFPAEAQAVELLEVIRELEGYLHKNR